VRLSASRPKEPLWYVLGPSVLIWEAAHGVPSPCVTGVCLFANNGHRDEYGRGACTSLCGTWAIVTATLLQNPGVTVSVGGQANMDNMGKLSYLPPALLSGGGGGDSPLTVASCNSEGGCIVNFTGSNFGPSSVGLSLYFYRVLPAPGRPPIRYRCVATVCAALHASTDGCGGRLW
jgi:hypothetical protein